MDWNRFELQVDRWMGSVKIRLNAVGELSATTKLLNTLFISMRKEGRL
jgi:hypothetical protein